MNKLSPGNLLVAAALFSVFANSAWSEQAAPSVPAAAAGQTASPGTGYAQGYGYEQYWQPPPWHEPPPPPRYYGHFDPYYPPYRQYRSAPAAPAENPLSAELEQAREQLSAKNAELSAAKEQLDTLQAEQQAVREVMQQAQAETAKASEQLNVVVEEMDILYEVLSELKARLDVQNISLQGAVEAGAEESDEGGSADTGGATQKQSPAAPSDPPGNVDNEETEAGDNELTKPEVL